MKHYVIEYQVIDHLRLREVYRHIEVIRETLEDAIAEIEISKFGDPLIQKFLSKEIFYGPLDGPKRRFMYTFETKDGAQASYIVHEIEENDITRDAIMNGRYNRSQELLKEL